MELVLRKRILADELMDFILMVAVITEGVEYLRQF